VKPLRITSEGFIRDGQPFRILAGSLHYFRVMPEQWGHRLSLLRAMGLNTVDTYVPWNLHEPRPGEYVFDGLAGVERFLLEAADAGLQAIVRPGPYICSEWDNGGLPAWLLADPTLHLRCTDERYLAAVDRWFDQLIPRLLPHLATRGGNVVLMQVENDYGRYGSDTEYLVHLVDGLRRRGIDVPLYACDDPHDLMRPSSALRDVLATVWFEGGSNSAFAALRAHRPGEPLFCSELVCGPFDHWGELHHTRDAVDVADVLDQVLAAGASVDLYMGHGGTNFGFWSGANHVDGKYLPTVTSYDYDSPVDERGATTEKFWRLREVIGRYMPLPPAQHLAAPPTLPGQRVVLSESAPLLRCLPELSPGPISSPYPLSFEELGLAHGFALYQATLYGPRESEELTVQGLADRAQVMFSGTQLALLDRNGPTSVALALPDREGTLEVLVESMGRVNWGPFLGDRKGITGGVSHGRQFIHGWRIYPIPLDDVSRIPWRTAGDEGAGPIFYRGTIHVADRADSFLALPHWGKGYVWVNGFCLGRYWDRGPQRTLYLPWPLLRQGLNEIVVLEIDHCGRREGVPAIELREEPDLGPRAPSPQVLSDERATDMNTKSHARIQGMGEP